MPSESSLLGECQPARHVHYPRQQRRHPLTTLNEVRYKIRQDAHQFRYLEFPISYDEALSFRYFQYTFPDVCELPLTPLRLQYHCRCNCS